ncbi:SPOR domain-containing protein [Vibrio gallicus]|uniref:SPOR domain-containing protein n=1 Tax=Vibrio gallicus TaxID=190897 RepID=UPI0021C29F5D|nr:SPOR domain-containing protein [Vibrio gallicus]
MKKIAIISIALLLGACSSSDEYQTQVESEGYQEQFQQQPQVVDPVEQPSAAQDEDDVVVNQPVVQDQQAISEQEVAATPVAVDESQPQTDDANKQAPSQGFAIQLATLSDHDKAMAFAKSLNLDSSLWVQQKQISGKTVYSVVMGDFGDYDQTKATIAAMPQDLQKLKPFVKNFSDSELSDTQSFELIK